MAKASVQYVCNSCGNVTMKWAGKCDACNEWNTITEEATENNIPKGLNRSKNKGNVIKFTNLQDKDSKKVERNLTGNNEFDRVCGGGLVPGSALLIGGDPGIGKSTLLLQISCAIANKGQRCLYVSGEEATEQIRLRAERLGLTDTPLELASATNVRDIISSMEDRENPVSLIVIDSIQTMYVDIVESAPGTVTQVRACTHELIRAAKKLGITLLIVGHVTKEGQIAGPRVLEHMVDTVLYFEGDRGHQFRILRAVKNRFGPTDEIGVFEMAQAGLMEVSNPSELFLAQRQSDAAGSAVFAGLEGTRPVLVEVQALVTDSPYATPRRQVLGWDSGRLAMIMAVLETRCGLNLSGCEVYLNIAGGIKINEPAADLAVAAALLSAHTNKALPENMIFFGEVGLAGEIRQVSQADARIKEAAKLGFETATIPKIPKGKNNIDKKKLPLNISEIKHISDLQDI